MKVCFVVEGCYPYVMGGVSSWVHSIIKMFPHVEFAIAAVIADRSYRGKFVYELPENVSEIYEIYLNDKDWITETKTGSMPDTEYATLRQLIMDRNVDWDGVFEYFQKKERSLNDLLMGEDFLNIITALYDRDYPEIAFTDFLWTMRSLYLPLFHALVSEVPKADIYHCVATGYAGIIGCMGHYLYGGKLLLSEHGIYTREREEELIKADWVQGIYKDIWIALFRKMSQVIYDRADKVISLFEHARELQIELGCPPEKTQVIHNGIDPLQFDNIPGKTEEDEDFVNIGAFLRIAPIKDVKTMIQAFSVAKKYAPKLKLWIMGPDAEDVEYARECYDYVDYLKVSDIEFTGRINTREYIGRMDATILTSISEGQPLTILEGYAAHKPAIATDVGNCRGLIYGENDDFGTAGILTHVMNVDEIASAMVFIAKNREKARAMGEIGYKRMMNRFKLSDLKNAYTKIYKQFGEELGLEWQE